MKIIKAYILTSIAIALVSACSKPCLYTSIDDQWKAIKEHGGCIMGAEDWNAENVRNGISFAVSEGASRSNCWSSFIQQDKAMLKKFLFTKLSSQERTPLHTDPFDITKEGELALYALQQLEKKNWYEYQGDSQEVHKLINESKERDSASLEEYMNYRNDQMIIWDMLNNETTLVAIKEFYGR